MKRTAMILALLAAVCCEAAAQSARWAVPPKYQSLELIKPGLYEARNKQGKREYVTNRGETVKKSKFKAETMADTASITMPDSLTVFQEDRLYGYRTPQRVVLQPQFTEAQPFADGYAVVKTEDGCGLLRLLPDTLVSCTVLQNEHEDNMDITVFAFADGNSAARPDAAYTLFCKDNTGMEYEAKAAADESGQLRFTIKTFREPRTFTVFAEDKNGSLAIHSFKATLLDIVKPETPIAVDKKASSVKKKTKKSKTTKKKRR